VECGCTVVLGGSPCSISNINVLVLAVAFLYKLGIVLFESRLFLITSDGDLRRNRHDIYASNIYNKQ
jgi:hypothetical protein